MFDRMRALRAAWLQMVGMPDYDRYLEHMASHHPHDAVLTRGEFCSRTIDRKYRRGASRCC